MSARILRFCVLLMVSARIVANVSGQAPAEPATFDVVSVKLHANDGQNASSVTTPPGGWFTANNITLRFLILSAYQVQEDQVVNGPDWVKSDRFDIVARGDDRKVSSSQLVGMLQALLADRFKLAVHHAKKELPVYALTYARSDRILASGWRPTQCPEPEIDLKQPVPCTGNHATKGQVTFRGSTLALILRFFAPAVGRVVIDRTGMKGCCYDVDLTWTPSQPVTQGEPQQPLAVDPNRPTIFTATREQLGLKLESTKALVDVLVIDHVEHPTEN